MPWLKAVEENFDFLVIEVEKQIEDTMKIIEGHQSEELYEKIESRDDYIDILKNVIENKASSFFLSSEKTDKNSVTYIMALTTITGNLEHIADYAVNIMGQTKYFNRPGVVRDYNYKIFFDRIFESLSVLTESVHKRDINLALDLCKVEPEFDRLYSDTIANIIQKLKTGEDTENLITLLFIFQYLERIGDAILNIGEAIMSIVLGERIKIHQYQAMAETIHGDSDNHEYAIEPVAESRSGNIIRRVREEAAENPNWVIFKEGKASKIEKEKEGIETWTKINPDLVPKIYGFEKKGYNASLVVEFLKGNTLRDIVINSDRDYLNKALETLKESVTNFWEKTIENKPICPTCFKQLSRRISDVYLVHPEFKIEGSFIGDIEIMPLGQIISSASFLDRRLTAPFSVIVHGDFNLDNILYNESKNTIHYIDLHRAKRADYVQDVSVFLISNFRLPFFEKDIRKNINHTILDFFKTSKKFAEKHNDTTFQARLSAGLIRSYITSTRFELNKKFAKLMYLKAIYLLESMMNLERENWDDFELHEEILIY